MNSLSLTSRISNSFLSWVSPFCHRRKNNINLVWKLPFLAVVLTVGFLMRLIETVFCCILWFVVVLWNIIADLGMLDVNDARRKLANAFDEL